MFSFKQVTKAVHLCVGSGSHVRVYQPWTVHEYGYTTSVVAKLLQVEATTSLAYRQLIEADMMDVREFLQLLFSLVICMLFYSNFYYAVHEPLFNIYY